MPTYITVIRMPASFFIPLDTRLQLDSDGNLVRFFSESVEVEGQRVPRELVAEVRCEAPSLLKALESSAQSVIATTQVMSFIANAHVGFPEIDVAFDATPGVEDRDFFQRRLVPSPNLGELVPGRYIDAATAGPVHAALAAHRDGSRLLAAISHYSHALSWWRPGNETLALAHLWMGVENLTGAVIRQRLATHGSTEADLMDDLQVSEKRDLRPAVRQHLVFRGDKEAYLAAKNASDGFEHGFMNLVAVRRLAQQVHVTVATYLREAVFELLDGLSDDIRSTLLGPQFQRPRGPLAVDKYFWGKLKGQGEKLSADGFRYPCLDWSEKISKVSEGADGTWSFSFDDKMTVRCGDGFGIQRTRYEVWDVSAARDFTSNTRQQ